MQNLLKQNSQKKHANNDVPFTQIIKVIMRSYQNG